MKIKCILILSIVFAGIMPVRGASFSYLKSRVIWRDQSSIDSAWVGKNVDIVRNDSAFVLTLNGTQYILSKESSSGLIDENTWMEEFGIKDKVYTLFFEIDDGKSILKSFAIREKNGTFHLFMAGDDPIRWDRVPAIFINSASFAWRNNKGKIISKFDSRFATRKDFLVPRIACQSLYPGERVDLDVKIIDPRGNVLKNGSSPEGYTFSASVVTSDTTLKIAERLLAWDDQRGIVFSEEGRYKIEIYNEQTLLNSSTLLLGRPAVKITGPIYETCPVCHGTGRSMILNNAGEWVPCSACNGTGRVVVGYGSVIKDRY